MDADRITDKLNIWADAAKYDVSCVSGKTRIKFRGMPAMGFFHYPKIFNFKVFC